MRKESQHYQQSQNINQLDKQQCQDNRKTIKKLAEIKSKADFIQLLKSLPIEIRYLAVKVEAPGLPHSIRNALKKLQSKSQISETKKHGSKVSKIISEALVFVSDGRQYFDSICFDYNYIQYPQKLYDLLMNPQQNTKKFNPIQQMNKNRKPIPDCIVQVNLCKTKQELFATVIKILRHQIFYSCCKKGYIQLNDQKNRKKQLSFYWKNLSQESKRKILLLNKGDFKELFNHLLSLNINIKLDDLEKEFTNLLSLEKNQFCNRILKCKLRRSLIGLTDYHQQVYNIWKRDLDKTKRKRNRKNNHMKQQHEKVIKQSRHNNVRNQSRIAIETSQKMNVKYLQKQKHIKHRQNRQKSHSVDSFQTNETQIQWQLKFKQQNHLKSQQKKVEIQKLIEEKITNNIIQCSDFISAEANLFYERRLIAYKRIQYVMGLYGIPIKLFGSCANGIAIKDSDIDIALDNCITNYFNLSEENQRPKFALEWMTVNFSNFKWVQNLKLLKNATIPIIKLTVNTQVDIQPVSLNYQMTEETMEYLNSLNRSHNKGRIQVDITIETQSKTFQCNHLGIKTTQQINQWLQAYKPLRCLTIILKNYLTIQNLNVTYEGGINTYVTIVMLVAAIYKLNLQNQENVNIFTESILKFYAFQFDQTKFGIDIRDRLNPFYLKKIQQLNFKKSQYSKAELQVLDPLNNGKVMTKKCYNFSKIKDIFQAIYAQCFSKFRKQQEQLFSMKSHLQKQNLINQKKQAQINSSQTLASSKEMICDKTQCSDIQTASEKQKSNRNPFLWIFRQKCFQMVVKQKCQY